MITKKTTALLGSLLLLAAAMPLATAHLSETGSYTSGTATGDGDYCRKEGAGSNPYTPPAALLAYLADLTNPGAGGFDAGCIGNNGVSGTYEGPAGAYIDSPTVFGSSNPFYVAFALCDLEVLGAGSEHDPLDEERVDADSGPAPSGTHPGTGGFVPDGTWDDGGQGAACHTNNQYAHDPYNTPGCRGTAYAHDLVSNDQVWIGTACDWMVTGGGDSFTTCVVNELISDPTTGGLTTCVMNFVNGGGNGASFQGCGGEGVADAVNFGRGTGVAFPSYATHGDPAHGCNPGDESAVVFVFEYADETGVVTPAVQGWIDNPDG